MQILSGTPLLYSLFILVWLVACQPADKGIQGQQWEKLSLDFVGPMTAETAPDNPFLNYRLQVDFRQGDKTYSVPGFYAADGNAAESSADSGHVWRVHFRPDSPGKWTYQVSFRQGENIAISDDAQAGKAVAFDGQKGSIEVAAAPPQSKGKISRVAGRYLQYAGTGEPFLKGGAGSPENFLGYEDFDGTYKGEQPQEREGEATARASLHRYEPHLQDWQEGDPTWQKGKGKGIIGALNYLAAKGMNSVYFLTMNIKGDGKDVWPYTSYEERYRFDCSKLDQWEIVFDHMDELGLMLHVITQETENEKLLDDGDLGIQRKLYYRELIARFSHHLGVTWNMGEENGPADFSPNGQSMAQQREMFRYFKNQDPYPNFVVVHTHANPKNRWAMYEQHIGDPYLDGISIQTGNPADSHSDTQHWLESSADAGKTWVICIDEIGPHFRGADPDDRADNNQDTIRAEVLWGNLMAGGAGVEWYFGYRNHNNDLGCEDWRSRDRLWDYTRYGLEFFRQYLPFEEIQSANNLIEGEMNYALAKAGEIYAIYLSWGGSTTLNLEGQSGTYSVRWYNPRQGGGLQDGSVPEVEGGSLVALGDPPRDPQKDWAILVQKK
jgi:hypothetical protein